MKYVIYTDPGHAWLRVPLSEVIKLQEKGLQISSFSYRNSKYAFLEEDCDMPRYFKFIGENAPEYQEIYHENSPVRYMERL